jgi:hypothetical protein
MGQAQVLSHIGLYLLKKWRQHEKEVTKDLLTDEEIFIDFD